MALLRATATVGFYTLFSRVLGFIRDILLASILGAGMVADCFVMAFKFPNFFRRMFAEGAFSAAFLPIFSSLLENQDLPEEARKEQARVFAEESLAFLLFTLLIFVAFSEIIMPWLLMGPALGFIHDKPKYDLAVYLTRLTFPYLLFISLVSLLGGVLNAMGKFAAMAFTPALLNGTMIVSIFIGDRYLHAPAEALSIGVSIAGLVQFLWLWSALRRNKIVLRLKWPHLTPGVKRLLKLILPAALGAGAFQVNLLVDVFLAGFLKSGSLSYLYYADRINQLPLGVVGVAVGTALLPLLARQVAAGHIKEAMNSQNRAIEMSLFMTVPAMAAIMALSVPIIRVLFERNAFTADTTLATAAALSAFAVGLPAYVLVKVLGPGFYARQDTATPVRYAMMSLLVNFVLNIALIFPLKHVGIALATALAAWVNVGQLTYGLIHRDYFTADARLKKRILLITLSSLIMGLLVWYVANLLDAPLHGNPIEKTTALVGLVVLGMVSYGILMLATGGISMPELKKLSRGKVKP